MIIMTIKSDNVWHMKKWVMTFIMEVSRQLSEWPSEKCLNSSGTHGMISPNLRKIIAPKWEEWEWNGARSVEKLLPRVIYEGDMIDRIFFIEASKFWGMQWLYSWEAPSIRLEVSRSRDASCNVSPRGLCTDSSQCGIVPLTVFLSRAPNVFVLFSLGMMRAVLASVQSRDVHDTSVYKAYKNTRWRVAFHLGEREAILNRRNSVRGFSETRVDICTIHWGFKIFFIPNLVSFKKKN